MDRRERDASWVKSFSVQVHGSMTCWKPDGKDPNDLQKMTEEFVRCSPNWQGKKLWRRDYVWTQEYTEEITRGSVLGGRRLGELQLIISVQDPERSRMIADDDGISRKKSAVYTGALLDRLQVLNNGRPHEIHGMVEAQHWGLSMLTNSSETCWSSQAGKHNFGCRNFYYVFTGERDTKRACIVYRQVQNMTRRVSMMSTTISTASGISIIRLSAKWQAVSNLAAR